MSDLISRSELLKAIEFWGGDVEALHEYIQNMPTAYDIDKVIEELEMEMKASSGYSEERVSAFSRAIEIVKHGGVGKDVD